MNRRVVITGCGAVSPVGSTVERFWENLKNGKCGIDFFTQDKVTTVYSQGAEEQTAPAAAAP